MLMISSRSLLTASILFAAGCGDDGGAGPGSTDEGPVYVMMTQVYTADDRTIYFSLSDTLDIDGVSFADSIESPGVANFSAIGGKLYISSGEQPKITRYDVLPDLGIEKTGEVSFAGYPFSDNANFYYHYIVDEDLAYLPYDVSKRVVWSPKELAILSDETESALPLMDNDLMLEGGGNRTAIKYPDGNVVQPFFFHDTNWTDYGTTSRIASYDVTSHDETRVQTVNCPALGLTTRDEAGNTYISTDSQTPVKALYGVGPAPCHVKLDPSGTVDSAWTTDLRSQTNGRYVMNFRYLTGGKAIGHVLDATRLTADFNGPYDATVEDQIWEDGKFDLWMFDVDANTAQPITGIDLPVGVGGQTAVIDGRMFVMVIYENYGKTRVYELSADGVATPKFDVAGDVFKWERLR